MRSSDFTNENQRPRRKSMHFLRPGELKGSYTDQQLRDLGFRKSESGVWYIAQNLWQALRSSGRLHESILAEGISDQIYHYTGIRAALEILKSGHFELSSAVGSDFEYRLAPQGYPYFFSTTRTITGGYHQIVGDTAVLFELDGRWFRQHYPGRSVDYWNNRNPMVPHHRTHEAEDRIFSREPTIPLGGVIAVHLLVKPDTEARYKTLARRVMIQAKKRNIPVYLYHDPTDWRRLDRRKLGRVTALQPGEEPVLRNWRSHRGYLIPWVELISAQDTSQLSKQAQDIVYGLKYSSYRAKDIVRGLSTDLSNARKPQGGPDRNNSIKIIRYMQRNRLTTVAELVNHIKNRWVKEPDGLNENFADGRKPGRRGLSRRVGIPRKATLAQLEKIAKSSTGERRRMAQWQLNMRRGRAKKNESLEEVRVNNTGGIGAVPFNADVDYHGLRVMMRPSMFLRLAEPLDVNDPQERKSIEYCKTQLDEPGIGAPFLTISIPEKWEQGDFRKSARVTSHDGRHRCWAILEAENDNPIEMHIRVPYYRRRDFSDAIVQQLRRGLFAQYGQYIPGPIFDLPQQ